MVKIEIQYHTFFLSYKKKFTIIHICMIFFFLNALTFSNVIIELFQTKWIQQTLMNIEHKIKYPPIYCEKSRWVGNRVN